MCSLIIQLIHPNLSLIQVAKKPSNLLGSHHFFKRTLKLKTLSYFLRIKRSDRLFHKQEDLFVIFQGEWTHHHKHLTKSNTETLVLVPFFLSLFSSRENKIPTNFFFRFFFSKVWGKIEQKIVRNNRKSESEQSRTFYLKTKRLWILHLWGLFLI